MIQYVAIDAAVVLPIDAEIVAFSHDKLKAAMWRDSAELLEVIWPGQRGC